MTLGSPVFILRNTNRICRCDVKSYKTNEKYIHQQLSKKLKSKIELRCRFCLHGPNYSHTGAQHEKVFTSNDEIYLPLLQKWSLNKLQSEWRMPATKRLYDSHCPTTNFCSQLKCLVTKYRRVDFTLLQFYNHKRQIFCGCSTPADVCRRFKLATRGAVHPSTALHVHYCG